MSGNFFSCSKDPFEFPEGSLKSEHALRMSASFLMTLSWAGFLTLAPGTRPHPKEPRFRLFARDEGSFPYLVEKEFPRFPSHLKRRPSPQERG